LRRAVDVTVFEQGVAEIVDDVGVVAAPPVHAVGAGAAVDDVVAFVAVDDVVELVAGRTARAELSLTAQWLKPGLAQE
jgi:hypothetical protein